MATTAETLQSLLEGETANTGAINTLTKQMAGTTASGLKTKIETLDGQVVKTTGNQDIAGTKTFASTIVAKYTRVIKKDSASSYAEINGGTNYTDGGHLILVGSEHTDDTNHPTGSFALITGKDEDGVSKALVGKPDGSLRWSGEKVKGSGFAEAVMPYRSVTTIAYARKGEYIQFTSGVEQAQYNCFVTIGSKTGNSGDYIILVVRSEQRDTATVVQVSATRSSSEQTTCCVPVKKGYYVYVISNIETIDYKFFSKCSAEV